MLPTIKYFILFCFMSGLPVLAQFDSFEGAYPHWSGDGTLSTTTDHYKHGNRSLKWNWDGGDVLLIEDLESIGAASLVEGDVFGYYQNTFELWIHNADRIEVDSLIFEFYNAAGVMQYYYYIFLDFEGWRAAKISYRYDMFGIKADDDLVEMRIIAPSSGSGEFCFDRIDYTTARNTSKEGDLQTPYQSGETYSAGHSHWDDMLHTMDFPITEPLLGPTAEEIDDINLIFDRYHDWILGTAPSGGTIATANGNYDDLDIVISGDNAKGKPLFGSNHSSSEGIYQVERILWVFAKDYQYSGDFDSYDKFMNLIRYMLDQGFGHGSLMETVHHIGYNFRNIPKGVFLMKEELIDEGLWTDAQEMVEWYVNLYVIWDPEAGESNMDEGNTRVLEKLGAVLHKDTYSENLQYLKGFRNYIEKWVAPEAHIKLGNKPDFSGFHHSTSYPGYSNPAFRRVAQAVYYMAGTSIMISDESRGILKNELLAARVGMGGVDIPYGMVGRKAFETATIESGLYYLGLAEPADPELLAARNKVYGVIDGTEEYGVEVLPEGFWQFNYGSMGIYRKEDWTVALKGFKKHMWGTETYTNDNRFGRYQSYGSATIYYDGGRIASGYRKDGWDWNRVAGTTVIELSMSDLEPPTSRLDEHTEKTFAGSMRYKKNEDAYIDGAIEGEMGIFAMDFQQEDLSDSHDPTFKFRKSVFCADGKMVCVGSGIENSDASNRTITNLFQLSLLGETQDAVLNGTEIISFPYSNSLSPGSSNWMIDNYGTGYYLDEVPGVEIIAETQTMPDHKDSYTASGDFISAYIDHGFAPADENYVYVILPDISSPEMELFYSNMADPITAYYEVLSSDPEGHVMVFNETGIIGYALFESNSDMTYGRIIENSDPCLVYEEEVGDTLFMSISTPDLKVDYDDENLEVGTANLDFILDGVWYLYSAEGGEVTVLDGGVDETILNVEVLGGEVVDIVLGPFPTPPVAEFSAEPTEICEGESVAFVDESSNDPTAWDWTFGDGETSEEENPIHTYDAAGIYSVELMVSNDFGEDMILVTDLIHVFASTYFEQTIEICEGENIEVGENTYDSSGLYSDTLTNGHGCDSIITTSLTVNSLPEVSWNPDESVIDGEICKHAGSVELTGEPEGGVFSGAGIAVNFFLPGVAGEGIHEIVYTYTDENGCENNFTMDILVLDCVGIEVFFESRVAVYPNPTSDNLTITGLALKDHLILTNSLGKIVYQCVIQDDLDELYFSELASGTYNLAVIKNSLVENIKIVVLE
ncbi:MAG: chondroitin-sulfate-ABC endolyase/exolyase [Crocinitomix sp.]|jgi:chondroitin-sulfate-ABC endolyase/exolyase